MQPWGFPLVVAGIVFLDKEPSSSHLEAKARKTTNLTDNFFNACTVDLIVPGSTCLHSPNEQLMVPAAVKAPLNLVGTVVNWNSTYLVLQIIRHC